MVILLPRTWPNHHLNDIIETNIIVKQGTPILQLEKESNRAASYPSSAKHHGKWQGQISPKSPCNKLRIRLWKGREHWRFKKSTKLAPIYCSYLLSSEEEPLTVWRSVKMLHNPISNFLNAGFPTESVDLDSFLISSYSDPHPDSSLLSSRLVVTKCDK